MCGIAGTFETDLGVPASKEVVERMTRVLRHRGPDDVGIHVDGPAALGHRRLSIIDLQGGRQPIFSEDRTKAIIFNGEIYNFKDVRDSLVRKGYRFATGSDTEAILHAYEEYGERCVDHLRGMFAFAIWNADSKELFLARDRLGIKPLYYAWAGGRFLFASELKGILQDPTVARDIDLRAVDDYLTYMYVPGPKSIFRAIRKLPPGHTLTVSRRGQALREYWDLSFEPREEVSERAHVESLRDHLEDAVSSHLVSDVPLGAFLSGGLDSTTIVGFMARHLRQPVLTESVGFSETAFDELPYARRAADHFRALPHETRISARAADVLDRLVWFCDEPFADSSLVPTYYVCQAARQRVTVCLSGDGGDENFAGYRRYRFDLLENRLRSIAPERWRRPIFGRLGRWYPKADWLPRVVRGKTLLSNLGTGPEEGYFNSIRWFTPAMKAALYRGDMARAIRGYDAFSVVETHFAKTKGWHPLSRVQYVDIKTYLVDDILTKVDRASMAHSLEVRVPLLDHVLTEHAATIPARFKQGWGRGKYVLRKAVEGIVPAEIIARRKMGFSIPLATWLRGELKPLFEERVFQQGSLIGEMFDTQTIRRWWTQHQRGSRDYAYPLWALLFLACWDQRFRRGSV